MDIGAKVNEIIEKLKKDPALLEKFKKDPVKALESITGLDLPDEQVNAVITAIKGKLSLDKIGDLFGK
ncbi:MAG: hypothetical protein UHN88_01830 [Eubacterium sp.]|nr:hypothetical protein [Eubacterium sp.]